MTVGHADRRDHLVIGTRGSLLARWQAEHVSEALRRAHARLAVEIRVIVTSGDRLSGGGAVADAGGKGVWVQEIEDALLAGEVDVAVHSLKDVPGELAPGLVVAAVPRRADPRDAVVSRSGLGLLALPAGSRVGTSSLRRACQIRALRADVSVEMLRGNVDTRLRKVADGTVDAAVLACAGIDRLGFGARITERLSTDQMLPAVGQGALAIEARADDERVLPLCRALADADAEVTIAAERALLARLEAGCRTPVAGHAVLDPGGAHVVVRGLVGRPAGSEIIRAQADGPPRDAAALGDEVARRLLAGGAAQILAELGAR